MTEATAHQAAPAGPPVCEHNDVVWGPVDVQYQPDGTVSVFQDGLCTECRAGVYQTYEPGGVQEHGRD